MAAARATPTAATGQFPPASDTATREVTVSTDSNPTPGQSTLIATGRVRVLGSERHPAASASAVIGSWTTKIDRQLPKESSTPAIAGPPNPITPHTIEFAANARGRSAWGYASPTAERATAITSPPPSPWNTRAAIRTGIDGAAAAAALHATNQTPVSRNVRRTPIESMTGPATIVATADVARYAVITQGSSDTRPRSAAMFGSAATIASPSNAAIATTVRLAAVTRRYGPDQIPPRAAEVTAAGYRPSTRRPTARAGLACAAVPNATPVSQLARGFAMGAADIVPGVSGGTVALVLGIYERLIHNVHTGAQALEALVRGRPRGFADTIRRVEWVWLLSLVVGILTAIALLASVIEDLLHDHPVEMAGLFFGLVAGSAIVAWRLIPRVTAVELTTMAGVAAVLFLVLGLREETEVAEGALEVVTEPWWVFFLSGALAICAMILPGISGSFILVMIGMYTEVLGAVNERDVVALAATGLGCVVGLALFSSALDWALRHHRDLVLAAMIGLMLGSLRVLWPWPGGTNSTELAAPSGEVFVPIALAAAGFLVVIAVELVASRAHPVEQP